MTYVYFLFEFLACNCNAQGSSSVSCSDTGICTCNANVVGDKCDACNAGFFDFPTCSGKHSNIKCSKHSTYLLQISITIFDLCTFVVSIFSL